MGDTWLDRIYKLIGTFGTIIAIVVNFPRLLKVLRGFMDHNPGLASLIPAILHLLVLIFSPIIIYLYLRNRRWAATVLGVFLFPIISMSLLIGEVVVTIGTIFFVCSGFSSYWVWSQRTWRWCGINWNPPHVTDVKRKINGKVVNGSISRTEGNSLEEALEGLDGPDLEILRILDYPGTTTVICRGLSTINSFDDLATSLSKSFPELGGEISCKGRLNELERSGLIEEKEAWSEASRYTTQLGQRMASIIRELNE